MSFQTIALIGLPSVFDTVGKLLVWDSCRAHIGQLKFDFVLLQLFKIEI